MRKLNIVVNGVQTSKLSHLFIEKMKQNRFVSLIPIGFKRSNNGTMPVEFYIGRKKMILFRNKMSILEYIPNVVVDFTDDKEEDILSNVKFYTDRGLDFIIVARISQELSGQIQDLVENSNSNMMRINPSDEEIHDVFSAIYLLYSKNGHEYGKIFQPGELISF